MCVIDEYKSGCIDCCRVGSALSLFALSSLLSLCSLLCHTSSANQQHDDTRITTSTTENEWSNYCRCILLLPSDRILIVRDEFTCPCSLSSLPHSLSVSCRCLFAAQRLLSSLSEHSSRVRSSVVLALLVSPRIELLLRGRPVHSRVSEAQSQNERSGIA